MYRDINEEINNLRLLEQKPHLFNNIVSFRIETYRYERISAVSLCLLWYSAS